MTSVRSRRIRRVVAVLAATGLVLGACSEDETGGGGGDGEGSATTTGFSAEEATEWALEYTGGTAGEAEGEPYRIGFAHSSDFFPEGDQAADAALEFINGELGGVGGRPLELVRCPIASPEDGAACGAELANDDSIDLVVGGLVLYGNADLYGALDGKAAAIMSTPLDVSDYTSPHAVSYTTGALGAGMGGAEFVNDELHPETSALVVTDDVAGRGGASVLTPIVEAQGIELTQVFVPPTATAPEVAAALQAAGAETADVVSLGLFEQGCIAAYDALKSLGLEPTVVTTGVCAGNGMQDHLKDVGDDGMVPDGWYFVGSSVYIPDPPPDLATYLEKMDEYGESDIVGSVAAPLTFASLLTTTKILNEVGVDNATYETLDEAVRGFTGPAMLQSGPIECGLPPYISICAREVPVARYVDGEWESVRGGSGAEPAVDLTQYLEPG